MQQSVPMTQASSDIPKSVCHAFSRVGYYSSFYFKNEDPMSQALKKFTNLEDKLGNLKLQLDTDVTVKFHEPLLAALSTSIATSSIKRRNVHAVRLTYDAARAKAKTCSPEYAETAKLEMEKAEDEFVAAVDESMTFMKQVVGSNDALRNLADLANAQLSYFKNGYEILKDAAAEIDEIQVAADAQRL